MAPSKGSKRSSERGHVADSQTTQTCRVTRRGNPQIVLSHHQNHQHQPPKMNDDVTWRLARRHPSWHEQRKSEKLFRSLSGGTYCKNECLLISILFGQTKKKLMYSYLYWAIFDDVIATSHSRATHTSSFGPLTKYILNRRPFQGSRHLSTDRPTIRSFMHASEEATDVVSTRTKHNSSYISV